MKIYKILLSVIVGSLLLSCNNDYIIGGENNPTNKVDMTTFEYLSSLDVTKNAAVLFEKAGLKNVINGDVTIISPDKWAIERYLRRRNIIQKRTDPDAKEVTLEDISVEDLQQMGMYILPGKYSIETIPSEGIQLTTHNGMEVRLSVDEVEMDPSGINTMYQNLPGSGSMLTLPKILHVHFKRGNNWETLSERLAMKPAYYDNPECDHVYRMYVSNVLTTNGVVHVLYAPDYDYTDHEFYHSLFFYGMRKDDTFGSV